MPGWDQLSALVDEEFKQAAQEGKDPSAIESLRARRAGTTAPGDLAALWQELFDLPVTRLDARNEPDDLAAIRAVLPQPDDSVRLAPPDVGTMADRLHGAWLGRCCGCVLGKPLEGMGLRGPEADGVPAWQRIKRYLLGAGPSEWPIADYIPPNSSAETDPAVGKVMCPPSTRGNITFVETDDDLRYTVLGLMLLREKGGGFTSWDVAHNWIRQLPYASVCTAETQAYHNLVLDCEFHAFSDFGRRAQDPDWTTIATHLNPYREWIGAQIRVDAYGYYAAGDPGFAAELAWRDARISHTKNGIYGAMFCAAMIAASFATQDPRRIVLAGLAQIPRDSRLAGGIRSVLAWTERNGCDPGLHEQAFAWMQAEFGGYQTVHTIPNAALCALAVLLSRGDFHHGITLAVMGGLDTDCNGATVGSIVGALQGAQGIPPTWIDPLNDTLRSGIADYHPIGISTCAAQTTDLVAQRLR